MPLDVLGRTRATLKESACIPWPRGPGNPLKLLRARDWGLQFFPMNEEFPVSASHKLVLITSLPFVHTARRYYRLNDLVRSSDRYAATLPRRRRCWEDDQTWSFRGSKSRNKVFVGEPAKGSLRTRIERKKLENFVVETRNVRYGDETRPAATRPAR